MIRSISHILHKCTYNFPVFLYQRLNFSNYCKMAKKALVFLAPGAEEMEFVISVDVLRRGGVS